MSNNSIISSNKLLCFVGGGPIATDAISAVVPLVDGFIGVDAGADHLLAAGVKPMAVIGDLDSVSEQARSRFAGCLHHFAEQSTTDFEKALTRVAAPMLLALGFTGGRLDHTLSVLSVLARHPQRAVILLDSHDASFVAPPGTISFDAPVAMRVSIMPFGRASVTLSGVSWPFENKVMTPDGFTSASNAALGGLVHLETDGPVVVTVPRAHWSIALKAAARAE